MFSLSQMERPASAKAGRFASDPPEDRKASKQVLDGEIISPRRADVNPDAAARDARGPDRFTRITALLALTIATAHAVIAWHAANNPPTIESDVQVQVQLPPEIVVALKRSLRDPKATIPPLRVTIPRKPKTAAAPAVEPTRFCWDAGGKLRINQPC